MNGNGVPQSVNEEVVALATRKEDLVLKTVENVAEDEALKASAQAKLRSLVDKPLTPRSLLEIEKTSRLLRELIAVGKEPVLTPRHASYGIVGNVSYGGGTGAWEPSVADDGLSPLTPMLASPTENFGANVIREVLAAINGKKEGTPKIDPMSAIAAISFARDKGLNDLAEKLEAKFLKEVSDEVVHSDVER